MKGNTHSKVRAHFRLIEMPCCAQVLCWVNPRLPNHCPECGMLWVTRSNSVVSILISNIYFVIQGWAFGPKYPGSRACSLRAAFPTKRRGR